MSAAAAPACTLELFHLRRVRLKAQAQRALAQHAGLSAAQAQHTLHQALGGGKPQVPVANAETARRLMADLAACGFIARRSDGGAFDPASHAHAALCAVLPGCPPAVRDAVAALLLQEQWPQALEWALHHLRAHRPPHDPDRQRLENTALDTGLARGVPGRT